MRKKKPVPWPFVMKVLTDHNITLPKEAVKSLLKIFLTQFEENRLWFSACKEWAKISPEFQTLIQSRSEEKLNRPASAGSEKAKGIGRITGTGSSSLVGSEEAPEDIRPPLKDPDGYTKPQGNKAPQEETAPSRPLFASSQTGIEQSGEQLNFKTDKSEIQSPGPPQGPDGPVQEKITSSGSALSFQTDPDQKSGEQSGLQVPESENRQTAGGRRFEKTAGPPLSSTAEAEADSLSFSEDGSASENGSASGSQDLSKHSAPSKSGLFSSGSRQVTGESGIDLEEQQLYRQLEFVQAKGLVEEEAKIISALMKKNPKRYKDLNKELKMKKALEFLQSQKLSGGEGKATHRPLSPSVSKKESPCKAQICKAADLLAEKHPEKAKDLAVFLYMLGWPDRSLKVLEGNLQSISEYWFYLSWLLEVRKYAVALDITNRLLVRLQSDSESLFPITYVKAQALYALGEKDKAVSYMSDIIKVRPAYKSARRFLEEWTKA